jgi:hypothetical protein
MASSFTPSPPTNYGALSTTTFTSTHFKVTTTYTAYNINGQTVFSASPYPTGWRMGEKFSKNQKKTL